ncbi:PPM-type phosphatase domain-containing protein [Plasmodiophora brassicae]|uniref:PPM-type phosphatase domain-containing protein n=1 Tax=Plasmodiophora brassicae TaxID=37360 RepID=A0A0G4IHY3_PLABS|nr:hypothetical protein PBRA_003636 [Plasmodiophora brassicae]SPQ94159.1 unnamed protein product [Plasmodiophora brassicae]
MDVYWTVGLIAPLLAFYLLMVWSRSRVLSRLVGRDPAVRLGSWAGVHSIQGRRQHMEDTFAYHPVFRTKGSHKFQLHAVFDGHGGSVCSRFLADQLPTLARSCIDERLSNARTDVQCNDAVRAALMDVFEKSEREYLALAETNQLDDGSTAVVAVLHSHHSGADVYVANLGDSRAVLAHKAFALPLSTDHKPDRPDERRRVESLGGRVVFWGTWRVQGILSLSRAIGDRNLKPLVSSVPEIVSRRVSPGDDFIILASDGLWDVLSSQNAVDMVYKHGWRSSSAQAARELTRTAMQMGSMDNITCMIIDLHQLHNK